MERRLHRNARQIGLLIILSALPAAAAVSNATNLVAQLANIRVNAAKVDAAGNIYLAGQIVISSGSYSAYIAKLSPDGATTFYAVTLGPNGASTAATALDVDSSGAAYVAGTTTATNFPVTAGAVQATGATAFAAKLDAKGNIVYSALIGGNTQTKPLSVVVNSKGELVISGQLTLNGPTNSPPAFLLKLSADGTQAVNGPQGVGGLVTADGHDNVYVAGYPVYASNGPPSTPGAFQGVPPISFCGCPFLSFACGGDQFVASLTADLSQTRFLTYVTAKYGATPAYIALDPSGNILIAGTTNAPDYPTTPASFQPYYTAASGTQITCGPPIPLEYTSPSGYVTSVKPDGSGLIFSTFFSGSKSDTITFAALTAGGVVLAGKAGSVDLPGFDGAVPSQCVPVGFVGRMTLDGAGVSLSHTPPGTPVAYDPTTGTLLLTYNNSLLRFDPSQNTPIACVLDAADLSPVTSIAPGELLALYGRFLYFETDPFGFTTIPVNGKFPVNDEGLDVAADKTPAPLLYVSQQQINFQAPYEIAGIPQTNLTLTYPDVYQNNVTDSRTFPVTATNPVAFVTQPSTYSQSYPLALNADGTVNSQSNPAAAGSVVTIFIDGLGITTPASVTGLVTTNPTTQLNLPLTVTTNCTAPICILPTFVSASPSPGSISGVTQVQLRAPANPYPGHPFQTYFSLTAGSIPVRDMNLTFWVE